VKTPLRPVTDNYHGEWVEDPYRWLEADGDPEVEAWEEAQNQATRAALEALDFRPRLRRRLEELLAIGDLGPPHPRGDRYFYMRRDAGQNHAVLYLRRGSPEAADEVVLDPNTWSEDGTEALDWYSLSPDGRLVAYGRSSQGDEWSTLYLLDVDSGRHLPDSIPRTRACSIAWLPDASGFYYTRYPQPGEVPEGQEHYHRRLFFHRLGADWRQDPLVFGQGRDPSDWPVASLSPDGRHLLITVAVGWTRTDVYVLDRETGDLLTLAEGEEVLYEGEILEGRAYLLTNWQAPRYRLVRVDLARPAREQWEELVPQGDSVLEWAGIIGRQLFATCLVNATSQLFRFDLDGRNRVEIPLPTLGSVGAIGGEWCGHEMFYSFTSFTVPPTVYRYDLARGESTLWNRVRADIDPDRYETRQVWYSSRDGTPIPMFLVHRRGLQRTGAHPTLLTGYGGFNQSMTPGFSRTTYAWLESGGLLALPNLRGGGEFGKEWHEAGMLGRKQNVFDDFLAAAEYLIAEGYTSPARLAIQGGSNGGLLVGAALTQRPDLFRAVVCSVPLLDMLRYHHFSIARLWIPEYGCADDPEQYRWLRAYSPYHNVRPGEKYPAVLLLAGAQDSRVHPMHARKMAARLQAASSSGLPVLLRIESKAGHGAGKPISKILEEATDTWSFLFWQLDLQPA
jgi:prolyl oligopeptidase